MLQSGKLRSGPSLEGGTNYRRPVQERTFFFFLFIAVERLFYVILENVNKKKPELTVSQQADFVPFIHC
eukprot:m.26231 g.26231  ORF g.26231 m.26231 type:complete len:69 (-) comp5840_c0_seq1:119-325(-)